MAISFHAVERIQHRVPDIADLMHLLDAVEAVYGDIAPSVAVRLTVLPCMRGPQDPDYYARAESNGEDVWAIIRDGDIVTTMLRRREQPATCAALRVERVIILR